MKYLATLSLVALMLGVASPAWACHFTSFTPHADCEGWSAIGEVSVSDDPWADLSYLVQLRDAGGELVLEFSGTERFYDGRHAFSYGEPWGMELCGDYSVAIDLHLQSDRYTDDESYYTEFHCYCEPPPPDGCTGTPGYWKNHPEAWPVDMLTVGCSEYSQSELLQIFDAPTRGDATVKLFHHTVAAMLNVMTGAGDGIQSDIDDAHDFLCAHPLFSRPGQPYKNEANGIKDELVAYNESNPCGETPVCEKLGMPQSSFQTPTQDSNTWGSVKAGYK